jgi:undecaprenyl-diphosphatase
MKNLDSTTNALMTQLQIPSFITISKVIGTIIDPEYMIILGLIIAGLIWFLSSKREATFLAMTMILTGVLTIGIKETIRVQRPTNSLIENSFLSFPSGHITITIVLLGIISYWIIKRYNSNIVKIITFSLATFLAMIVGFSRVYLNAHWFSDVLAGLFLGIFILSTCLGLKKYIDKIDHKIFD